MKKFCLLALLPVFMSASMFAADAPAAPVAPAAAGTDYLALAMKYTGNVLSVTGGYVVGNALGTAVKAVAKEDYVKGVAGVLVSAAAVRGGRNAQVVKDLMGDDNAQLAEAGAAAGFVLGEKPLNKLWEATKALCPCH